MAAFNQITASRVTDAQIHELLQNPTMSAIVTRVGNVAKLAAQKVVANHASPERYPLGASPGSFEQVFQPMFDQLSPAKKEQAAAKVMPLVEATPAARASGYGELAQVDLRLPAHVEDQAKALPILAVPGGLAGLVHPSPMPMRRVTDDVTAYHGLGFDLAFMKSIRGTQHDGILGKDRMYIAAVASTSFNQTFPVGPDHVGDLHEGDGAPFQRRYAQFDLGDGGDSWPKSYFMTLSISEGNANKFPDFVNQLYPKLRDAVAGAIGTAVGGLVVYFTGAALIGAAIGTAVAALLRDIFDWLKGFFFEDYVFAPQTLYVEVPSASALFDTSANSPQDSVDFSNDLSGFGGEFQVFFSWSLLDPYVIPGRIATDEEDDAATPAAVVGAAIASASAILPGATPAQPPKPPGGPTMPIDHVVVCARGTDEAMWLRRYDGEWSRWESIGGGFLTGPAAVVDGNRTNLFAVGKDGAIWHAWSDNDPVHHGIWSPWESIGGGLTSRPAAVMAGDRLTVFARGKDNALWHRYYANGWSDWMTLGGGLSSGPAAVTAGDRLTVFARGLDNALWHKWYDKGWSAWVSLGGVLSSGPAAAMVGDHPVVFARGEDYGLWWKWFDKSWSEWVSLGGALESGPAVVTKGADAGVFVRGPNEAIWTKRWSNRRWSEWESLGGKVL